MQSIYEQSALVTGSSTGIGKAISDLLQNSGWDVRKFSRLDVDLSDLVQTKNWLKNLNDYCPYLVVCNAGVNLPSSILEQSEAEFMQMLAVNFLSSLEIVKFFIPRMIQKGSGRVIFISSTFSSKSKSGRSTYSLTKSAMDSFIRSCTVEYSNRNILFNSIAPGFINTNMTFRNNTKEQIDRILERIPIGRFGDPQEVAELVNFLGSSKNTYITGQCINLDGGYSVT